MSQDTMMAEERLQAAVELKPVDRVPCAPWIVEYAGRFAGITNKEWWGDWDKKMDAFDKLHQAYPMWDVNREGSSGMLVETGPVWPMKAKFPGVDLEDNAQRQFVEKEFVKREDLQLIRQQGYFPYFLMASQKIHGVDPGTMMGILQKAGQLDAAENQFCRERNQTMYYGAIINVPFEMLTFHRSLSKAFKDVFQAGDLLDEIFPIVAQTVLQVSMDLMKQNGIKRVFLAGARSGPDFINKKNFERFCWPYYKQIALGLIENGFTPSFHFDGNWTPFLEYFLELPKGTCVLELDSATDIFRAKEILKGHMCILGDVNPVLFTVASPAEMDEYCKKLIQVVGADGGFIFSNGCTIPFNSKHENVKVFFEAVEKYGRYN